jgi:hypothetical protein
VAKLHKKKTTKFPSAFSRTILRQNVSSRCNSAKKSTKKNYPVLLASTTPSSPELSVEADPEVISRRSLVKKKKDRNAGNR